MQKSQIIKSLKFLCETSEDLTFYSRCLEHSNNWPDIITEIEENEYLLESVRINLCINTDFDVYISNTNSFKDVCYRKLLLTDKMYTTLLTQLIAIYNKNTIFSLTETSISDYKLEFDKKNDANIVYILFVPPNNDKIKSNNVIKLKNNYETLGYVCGICSIELLKYQRLDRINNFITKDKQASQIYANMDKFLKLMQLHKWYRRDRMILMSGIAFHAIGLTYTKDLDLLVITNESDEKVSEMLKTYSNKNAQYTDVEASILSNTNIWHTEGKIYKYKSIWLTYLFPQLVGAENIQEVTCNPKYHFMFMGIKIISLEMNVRRILSRASTSSLADLYMLEKINGYPINKFCLPNMTLRQGSVKIFNDRTLYKLQKTVYSKIIEYYNTKPEMSEIIQKIKRCDNESFEIYKGKPVHDPDTSIIKKYHSDVKKYLFYKFCKNHINLLDIGSGQMVDLKHWTKCGIDNVVGIEPSLDSIKNAKERIEKFEPYGNDKKVNVNIINGVGNEKWKDNMKKYGTVYDYKYNIITFQYTIHYMLDDIDIVIKNIKDVANNGATIMILCMDGNKIKKKLENGMVKVINDENEPIFVIDKFNTPDDIIVYFKGAYGVTNGSIEKLVDINKLVDTFSKNKFKLIYKRYFDQFNSETKKSMKDWQLEVSSYYIALVFSYN